MKLKSFALIVALVLSFSAPQCAHADIAIGQSTAQSNTAKDRKANLKQQKELQKQELKRQKAARRRLKKLHPEAR